MVTFIIQECEHKICPTNNFQSNNFTSSQTRIVTGKVGMSNSDLEMKVKEGDELKSAGLKWNKNQKYSLPK